MTREEAIAFGKMWLEMNEDAKDSSTYEFFQMALKALKQEPVLDKIKDEIETEYGQCDICEYFEDYDYEENDISEYRPIGNIADILQIINKYKSEIPIGSIEIKVGSEVTVEGINGIVVREPYSIGSDNELFVLVWYGQFMSSNSLKNVAPTGRYFPQITEVLEQLRRS